MVGPGWKAVLADLSRWLVGPFESAEGEPTAFVARWTDHPTPWFARHPVDVVPVAVGASAAFKATPAEGYNVTFQWQAETSSGAWCDLADGVGGTCLASNAAISGATTGTLLVSGVDEGAAGAYRCVIANACASVAGEPALLSVECYADCDGDGSHTLLDILCFQDAYASKAGYADCESDADWDLFDVLCFQGRFAVGCE